MVRGLLLGAAIAIVLSMAAAWIAISQGLIPIGADASPSGLERWMARTALIAGVMRRERHGKNPESGTAAIVAGIHIYQTDCQVCHGDDRGDATRIARGLYQRPPQFARDGAEDLPYAYSSYVIAHGVRLTGMPSFAKTLSTEQIAQVALFLQQMDHLTPDEAFAWRGAPLRPPLVALYGIIGGDRSCAYFPSPHVEPHLFREEASVTHDGSFILEHYYNRGISEFAVIGLDVTAHRFIRTKIAKGGDADIAVSPGFSGGSWSWTSIDGTQNGAQTTITPRADGSYVFRSTNAPGFGTCSPSQAPSGSR